MSTVFIDCWRVGELLKDHRRLTVIASFLGGWFMPKQEPPRKHTELNGLTSKELSNAIKHNLRKDGMTLKSFAEKHGFNYRTVSDVVRGIRRGYYGECRDVAEKLGII